MIRDQSLSARQLVPILRCLCRRPVVLGTDRFYPSRIKVPQTVMSAVGIHFWRASAVRAATSRVSCVALVYSFHCMCRLKRRMLPLAGLPSAECDATSPLSQSGGETHHLRTSGATDRRAFGTPSPPSVRLSDNRESHAGVARIHIAGWKQASQDEQRPPTSSSKDSGSAASSPATRRQHRSRKKTRGDRKEAAGRHGKLSKGKPQAPDSRSSSPSPPRNMSARISLLPRRIPRATPFADSPRQAREGRHDLTAHQQDSDSDETDYDEVSVIKTAKKRLRSQSNIHRQQRHA